MTKQKFRELCQQISLTQYLSYCDYLRELYQHLKQAETHFSYLKFAADLGFAPSNVIWLVITGRRKLTEPTARKIVDAIGLRNTDRRYFMALVDHANARSSEEREKCLADLIRIKHEHLSDSTLDQDTLEYFSEWYHPVIREMVNLEDFRPDNNYINAKLYDKLASKQIDRSIELLGRLGLIRYDDKLGRYVQANGNVTPDRKVEDFAATRYHQKMLDIARESLVRVPAPERDFNTLTLSISADVARKISHLIRGICEKVLQLETESTDPTQIFQVNLALFPLTKRLPT